jgi:hypothetical protein
LGTPDERADSQDDKDKSKDNRRSFDSLLSLRMTTHWI